MTYSNLSINTALKLTTLYSRSNVFIPGILNFCRAVTCTTRILLGSTIIMTSKVVLTSFTPDWIYPPAQTKQLISMVKRKKRKGKVAKNVVKMRREVTRMSRVGNDWNECGVYMYNVPVAVCNDFTGLSFGTCRKGAATCNYSCTIMCYQN